MFEYCLFVTMKPNIADKCFVPCLTILNVSHTFHVVLLRSVSSRSHDYRALSSHISIREKGHTSFFPSREKERFVSSFALTFILSYDDIIVSGSRARISESNTSFRAAMEGVPMATPVVYRHQTTPPCPPLSLSFIQHTCVHKQSI